MKPVLRHKDHQLFLKPVLPGLNKLEKMDLREENIEMPESNGIGYMITVVS